MTVPTRSQTGTYDAWVDVNDDGSIDMADISIEIDNFMITGTPVTKASILYESDWMDVSDKAGQYFDVVHNLNSMDVIVDITGKKTADGAVHQRSIGGTDFVAGWNKTYGESTMEAIGGGGLVQTGDGGYALLAYQYTPGYFTTGIVHLIKTDSLGNVQWDRTFGGSGEVFYPSAYPLVQTIDGGYAFAFTKERAGAAFDLWLVRTDALGMMLWNRTYGGSGYEYLGSMIQTSEGSFALAGLTDSYGAGDRDGYLVVANADGDMLWNETYGGYTGDGFNGVVQTGDGFALAGATYSFGVGDLDMWLVKTNSTGYELWNQTYGTWAGEDALALIQTFDGGYAMAGTIHYGNPNARDMWLVKTDASGNMLWDRKYGGSGTEWAFSLVQTGDGRYTLAGFTTSFGFGYDGWLVRTDSAGNTLWTKIIGQSGNDYLYWLVQTSDGGYAMAGATSSYGAQADDAWLVKTDAMGNALDGFKYGLAWVSSTADSVTLYRGTDDEYWNYVRVRIWKPKAP